MGAKWVSSFFCPLRVSSNGLLGMINFFIYQACKSDVHSLRALTAETPLPVLIYVHYVSESVSVAQFGVGGLTCRSFGKHTGY